MRTHLRRGWAAFWPHRDHDVISWGLACLAWGWGIVLLLPGDTFSRSVGWGPFVQLYPIDAAWGAGLLLLGTTQHLARMTRRARVRRGAAAAGFAWWIAVWLAFTAPVLGGTPVGTGSAAYLVFAGGYAWLFARLRAPDAA